MFVDEKSKFARRVTFTVPLHSVLSIELVVLCVPKSYRCFIAVIKNDPELRKYSSTGLPCILMAQHPD
jgi:hypothetical protein